MFAFGDPASTAQLYVDDLAKNTSGPQLVRAPLDEMPVKDLKNALVWLWMSISRGQQDELEEPVMNVLVEWYDEVFVALASLDDGLLELLKKKLHVPPLGVVDHNKYLELARRASES
jgi:hypothetical protein